MGVSVRVTAAQMRCVTGDKSENLARIERYVGVAATQGTDIVVLPEMIVTGSVRGQDAREAAEPIPGPATERIGRLAACHQVYVVTGLLEAAGGDIYNAAVLHGPDGELIGRYRKCHLFVTEKETAVAGSEPAIFDIAFGRVALTICYDLVFPEYVRGLALQDVRLILNGTNWITDRWQTEMGWSGDVTSHLAATRALENGIHVVMANRVGPVDDTWRSLGHSCICAPSGAFLASLGEGEGLVTASIDLEGEAWDRWRQVATYLPDRRTALYERLDTPATDSAGQA